MNKWTIAEIQEKQKQNYHVCSNCYKELRWADKFGSLKNCPNCGHDKYYPYTPDTKISSIDRNSF